jgi:hypothetical protein
MILTGQLDATHHKAHVPLTFDVPAGTTQLVVRFNASPQREPGAFFDNLISLSLFGPAGPRGARHNNPVWDFAISETAATPGYLAGKIEPGTWTLYMDCFRVLGAVTYTVEVECQTATIAAQPAYVAAKTQARGRGWYRGDLHAHTLHSDGSWSIADLVAWARGRNLDFMTLTDHNTTSGHAEVHGLAGDDLLTLGGMELTTHWGHAVALGITHLPEWRVGPVTGQTMPMLAADIMAKDGLFVIAHPMSPGDPACTGCRWEYDDMRPGNAQLVEIWNGGPWSDYNEAGLAEYRHWLTQGHRLRATAGSDIHGPEGGVGQVGFNNVEAESLTPKAILQAVHLGRNYLSSGPRLILQAQSPQGTIAAMGETVAQGSVFHAEWQSQDVALMLSFVDAKGAQSHHNIAANAAGRAEFAGAEGFVMAELRDATGRLHAVTNPIFID